MKVWRLTQLGKRLARSTRNPDTGAWRIVHFLDMVGLGTTDQVAEGARLSPDESAGLLSSLRGKGVVEEASSNSERRF